ncbi:MAG: hypothetical protein JG776_483 [Caloramator sp.]|jgi:DnaD/phage-associated family protein|uniref:DnaD domain-containing protein n=1 Tax=Caloramator sp. TaxID=1871330 RepID=UPI001D29E5CF|nr:DnaD domain protein [Caloramator sp.]MBZ4662801.1 hypothetical protein [Caloramator sp.]
MNQQEMYKVIESVSGQNNILTIPTFYVKLTGSLETALMLSQLVYWSSRTKDGWVYKSSKEWQEEIFLTDYAIRKSTKKLLEMDVIETKIKKANGSPTTHYRVKKDKLIEWILRFQQVDSLNSTKPHVENNETITEITTEITTEIDDEEQQQHQQIKKIIEVFNNNIHNMTPIELEKINHWLEDIETEVIIKAIEEAVINNKRSFNYINKILNNWYSQGLKTKTDVEEYLRNWNKKKEQPNQPKKKKEFDFTGLL